MRPLLLPLLTVLLGTAHAQSRYPVRGVSMGLDVFQLARGLNRDESRQLRLEPYLRVPLRTDRWALVGSVGYNYFGRGTLPNTNWERTTGWFAKSGIEWLPGRLAIGLSGVASRYRHDLALSYRSDFNGYRIQYLFPPRRNTTLGLEVTALHHVPLGRWLYFRWGVAGVAYTKPLRADPLPYTYLPGIGREALAWGGERRIQTRFLVQVFYQFPGRRGAGDAATR